MQFLKLIFRKAKVFFFCLSISCIYTSTFAANYYVSPSGSTSWSECTNINTPCSAKTAMQNAQAGDTVYFRGGTYVNDYVGTVTPPRWTCGLQPSNSGTEGNPIVFKAYPSEIPFIDNSLNTNVWETVSSFGTYQNDYIIWDGLHAKVELAVGYPDGTGAGCGRGIQICESDYNIVRNCDIEGASDGLTNNDCIRIEHATYHEIYNNKIHGSLGTYNSVGTKSYFSSHGDIHHNDVYNNTQGLYDKAEGAYTNYHHNFLYGNDRGFSIASEAGNASPNNIKCYQNIFINHSGYVIDMRGSLDPHNNYIYNNVIVNCNNVGFYGIFIFNDKVTDIYIFNNIIVNNSGAVSYKVLQKVSLSNYNIFYNIGNFNLGSWGGTYYNSLSDWQSATGFDMNSKTNNPNFINPVGTSPEDYKRTSYPQDGRGGSYASVMGVYITGNEVIGYSGEEEVSPPSSPPNFSANN